MLAAAGPKCALRFAACRGSAGLPTLIDFCEAIAHGVLPPATPHR